KYHNTRERRARIELRPLVAMAVVVAGGRGMRAGIYGDVGHRALPCWAPLVHSLATRDRTILTALLDLTLSTSPYCLCTYSLALAAISPELGRRTSAARGSDRRDAAQMTI